MIAGSYLLPRPLDRHTQEENVTRRILSVLFVGLAFTPMVLAQDVSVDKSLVFRGTAQDERSDKVDKNQKTLEKATSKMFKDFPPPPGKK